jgi:hypothetical protein
MLTAPCGSYDDHLHTPVNKEESIESLGDKVSRRTHHAEGLVNPKMLANLAKIDWF